MEQSRNIIPKLTYVKFHLSKNLTQDIKDKIYSEMKIYLRQLYFKEKIHKIFREIIDYNNHVIKIIHINNRFLKEKSIYKDNKDDIIRFDEITFDKKKMIYLI